MDIEKIKKYADEKGKEKKKVIRLHNEMMIIWNECCGKWNKTLDDKQKEFIEDFKKYFISNGFTISQNVRQYVNSCIATYKDLKIILKYENDIEFQSWKMYLDYIDGYNSIELQVSQSPEEPNYMHMKKNFIVNDKSERDFIINGKDSFIEFLNSLKTVEEINMLQDQINLNISHFKEGIKKAENSDAYFLIFSNKKLYTSFKELINDLEFDNCNLTVK